MFRFITSTFAFKHIHISSSLYPKILEKFNMNKPYPSKTPMAVRYLYMEKDPFQPREEREKILGLDYPFLDAIDALM
jgi:hypothetical protein